MKTRIPIAIAMLAALSAFSYWAYDASRLYVLHPGRAGSLTYELLFDTAIPAILAAALIGIFLGTFDSGKTKSRLANGQIERHDELMFIQHWSHAVGTVILIITGLGLGFLFIPRTFQAAEAVGFAMNMHFVGTIFFLFGLAFYVTKGLLTGDLKHMMPKQGDLKDMASHYKAMFFKGAAPKEEKFLAAERVVFPLWIIGVSGITITGLFKIAAHAMPLSEELMGGMTVLHGVFAIFMIVMLIAHIIAGALLPASWPLIRSMVTGKVSEAYVKKHHEKWFEELEHEKQEAKVIAMDTIRNNNFDK